MNFRRMWLLAVLIPWLFACASYYKAVSRLDATGYYVSKSYGFKIKGPGSLECWEEKFEDGYLFILYHWQDCKKSMFLGYDGKYFVRVHPRWELGMKSNLKEWIERNYGGPAIDTVSKKGIQGWVVRKQGHIELTYSTEPWEAWYFICYNSNKDVLVFGYDGRQSGGVADFEALIDSLEFINK